MKKLLTICAILILAIIAGVFYFAQNEKVAQNEVTKDLIANEIAPEAPTQIKAVSDENDKITQNEEIKNPEIMYNADDSIDTSNWKTYTNEKYGFSVKYPEECIVYDKDNVSSKRVSFLDCHSRNYFTDGAIPDNAKFFGSVSVYYNKNSSIEQYIEKLKKECVDLGGTGKNIKKVIIDGKNGVSGGCPVVGDPLMMSIFYNNEQVSFIGGIQSGFVLQKRDNMSRLFNGIDITEVIYKSFKFRQK